LNVYVTHLKYDHTGGTHTYKELPWSVKKVSALIDGVYDLEPVIKNNLIYQFYLTRFENVTIDGDVYGSHPIIKNEEGYELQKRILSAYPEMEDQINKRY
jgi:hypothetical protein